MVTRKRLALHACAGLFLDCHHEGYQYRCMSIASGVGGPRVLALDRWSVALKALGDPVRLRLIELVGTAPEGLVSAGQLGESFDLSQPTISHHLRVLFDAGLLVRVRSGNQISYSVGHAFLVEVAELLTSLASGAGSLQPSDVSSTAPSRSLGGESAERLLVRGAEDLAFRFAGVFGRESVDRCVHESYQTLYRTATVKTHLPVLALRFALERLTALGQATGRLAKPAPEVLILCTHNAGRSQLAAAMMTQLSGGRVHVRTAGSAPAAEVSPGVKAVLTERGIAFAGEVPKPLTDDVLRAADVIVTMGCGDACPLHAGKRYLDWDLPDPSGAPLDQVRLLADQIDKKVRQLLAELGIGPEPKKGVSS